MTTAPRLSSLKRLAAVYEIVAYTDSLSLDRARVALREVELLLEQQSDLARGVVLLARDALAREDRQEWLLSESQVELALWNRTGLKLLRGRREALQDHAAERYRKSLREDSQIDALVEQAYAATKRAIARREQTEADDRYLSRMQWVAQRALRRVKTP
jgi:hypothetical protein